MEVLSGVGGCGSWLIQCVGCDRRRARAGRELKGIHCFWMSLCIDCEGECMGGEEGEEGKWMPGGEGQVFVRGRAGRVSEGRVVTVERS